jgi:hypothetical protein
MAKPPFNVYSGLLFPDYEFQEFPRWVKNAAGEEKIVADKEEMIAFIGEYFPSSENALERQIEKLRAENQLLKQQAGDKGKLDEKPKAGDGVKVDAPKPAVAEKPKG